MESLETAGLSTGFIVALGIAYRVLKNSNFQFSSSCRERLVAEATYEIKDRVRQVIEEEISKSRTVSPHNTGESKTTSPTYGASPPHIDTMPPLPPTPEI